MEMIVAFAQTHTMDCGHTMDNPLGLCQTHSHSTLRVLLLQTFGAPVEIRMRKQFISLTIKIVVNETETKRWRVAVLVQERLVCSD